MNILCVEQFANIGGGQRCLLDLLPGLSLRGWNTHVAIPGEGPLAQAVRALGVPLEWLPYRTYTSTRKPAREVVAYAREFPRLIQALEASVRRRRIGLLYVNGPRFLPAAAWVARKHSVPLVFHCHSRVYQRSAVLLAGKALQFSRARVIACCRHSVEPLRRYAKRNGIAIVHNGVSGGNALLPRVLNAPRRIGVVGRIEPEKGQMEFLAAARLILKQFPDCRFSIVGAPLFSDNDYYNKVVDASAGLPVRFSGWQEDVSSVFSELDLLVVPSTSEPGAPRVILEAYAAGVPVVAFPSGGIPEVLVDGETGFLAQSITPEALADRISAVLRMRPDAIAAITANAREAWEKNHTLELYRERVCQILSAFKS